MNRTRFWVYILSSKSRNLYTGVTNSLVTRFLQFARPLKLRMEKADRAQLLDRAITDFMVGLSVFGAAKKADGAPKS
jgi:hypothetical protein